MNENKQIKLLLIEDNPGDVRLVKELLGTVQGVHYDLDTAGSLAEGQAHCRANQHQALLLDLNLPDSRGLETVKSVLAKDCQLPIVILTGLNDEQLGTRAIELGAQDFLPKGSLTTELLDRAIRYAIERKRAEKELREFKERFTKLAAHVPGMIYQFTRRRDGSYCVPFTTEAIKDIFGCSPQDVQDDFSPIAKVILPADRPEVLASIERSARQLTRWQHEYRVQLPGQPVNWLFGHASPEQLTDGTTNWYGFNTIITERKLAEEALRQRVGELKAINEAVVGRELKLIDLENEVDGLRRELGREPKYK
jgi:DNA-binding NarL/FixJ family response regulator